MNEITIVAGSSGIVGKNLSHELIANGWTTYGLARRLEINILRLQPGAADLLAMDNLANALADIN